MKKYLPQLLLLTLLALAVSSTRAQPSSGGPSPPTPTNTPLDGGASLLLAGGVAAGVRYLKRRRAR